LDSRASIACEEIASAAIMRPNNKGEHIVSSKQPSHRAFVVTEPKQGSDQKGRWY
jgi:hypothetical protein